MPKPSQGFLLLEVILAVQLFLLAGCFLAQTLCGAQKYLPYVNARYQNMVAAANVMEKLKALEASTLTSMENYSFADGRGQVSIENFGENLIKITVWLGDKDRPEIIFETLRAGNY